jgi:hypothetical protein
MKARVSFYLVLFLICISLSACGSSQVELDVTATPEAAKATARYTAEPPSTTATGLLRPFEAANAEALYNLGVRTITKAI